jgi:hypothetical protein
MFKDKGLLIVGGGLLVLFVMYAMTKAFPYLKGPEVTVLTPKDGASVGTSTFLITGKALRVKELYLSGKSITIDPDGNFSETFVSYSPYTILVVEAVDRHNKRSLQTLTVTP